MSLKKEGATEPGNRLRKAACDAASASFYGVIYLGNLLVNCDNTDLVKIMGVWHRIGDSHRVPFRILHGMDEKWYGAGPDEAETPPSAQ